MTGNASEGKWRKKEIIFWAMLVFLVASVGLMLFFIHASLTNTTSKRKKFNQLIWEQTYLERDIPVPESGPREGYHGHRLGKKVTHPLLGWHESQIDIPNLLRIDQSGCQYFSHNENAGYNILIVGGSVAFGAYASEISKTYFHIMAVQLRKRRIPVNVTVFAAGAWKSTQELRALQMFTSKKRPDLVVLINGLNDLTNGATSKTLQWEKVPTHDGSKWTPFYHTHDFEDRVKDYSENIEKMAKLAANIDVATLFVLQPSLFERTTPTPLENEARKSYLAIYKTSEASFKKSYQRMRENLHIMEHATSAFILDCSRVLNREGETTFSDLWHFSDFGHEILGRAIAVKIEKIYLKRPNRISFLEKEQMMKRNGQS